MTRDRIAKLITIAVLGSALIFVILRKAGFRPAASDATPQDAIYGMLEAARAGDTARYLASYTGPMAGALKQTIAEQTAAGFRSWLQSRNAEIKGVALSEPKALSSSEAEIKVEYVYQDRNESQTMILEKQGSTWKIARVDTAERVKTLVPYGTPVQ